MPTFAAAASKCSRYLVPTAPLAAARRLVAMKSHSALEETSAKGEFKRTDAAFRHMIAKGSKFSPESGRYHLYVSLACPWASRCVAVMFMKGLQSCIGLSVVHPTWQKTKPDVDDHSGWTFAAPDDPPFVNTNGFGSFSCEGCIPDSVNGVKTVRALYDMAGDESGKYSVPVLWDKREKTIVNNESSEIVEMMNSEFNEWATDRDLNLSPEHLKDKMAEVNSWIYPSINNGVYRCGFAKSQQAYEEAFVQLCDALDKCEKILEENRYITGDTFTMSDIRLFVTIIRFDEVYAVYFKTNNKLIREYPNIREYVKDVYQLPGIAESVNMQHIKVHYYTSHPQLNWYAIVPKGSDPWYTSPHDREKFSSLEK